MSKPLRWTQHALDAMRERQLDIAWVQRAVEHPGWIEGDPNDPQVSRYFAAVPERGNRYLRVACVETSSEIRILSAFLDRGARPK